MQDFVHRLNAFIGREVYVKVIYRISFGIKDNTNKSRDCCYLKTKKIYNLYLEMELMQKSISKMVEKNRELFYIFLIDIIYQISRRILYSCDMHIAHCDLKLDNILLKMSKNEIGRNQKGTKNKYVYSSAKCMALEELKNKF